MHGSRSRYAGQIPRTRTCLVLTMHAWYFPGPVPPFLPNRDRRRARPRSHPGPAPRTCRPAGCPAARGAGTHTRRRGHPAARPRARGREQRRKTIPIYFQQMPIYFSTYVYWLGSDCECEWAARGGQTPVGHNHGRRPRSSHFYFL